MKPIQVVPTWDLDREPCVWVSPMHVQYFEVVEEADGDWRIHLQTQLIGPHEMVQRFPNRRAAERFIEHAFIPGDL